MKDQPSGEPLDPNTGRIFDQLIGLATLGQSPMATRILKEARLALRSARPTHEYVWVETTTHRLSEIEPQLVGEGRDAISDLLKVLAGQCVPRQVDDAWRLNQRDIPTPVEIELAAFRTTDSFAPIKERFRSHLSSEEPLEVLIRGHLWVEATMSGLLSRSLEKPEALDDARLSFSQTLALCDAMGLIPSDLIPVLRRLNKLRNRVAHNLDAELAESDQRELVALCSPRIVEISGMSPDPKPFPVGVATIIAVAVIDLHVRLDHLDAAKRHAEYLGDVVDEVLGRSRR